eukprot:3896443-Pleurochrysis_carterae.AAC.1
MVVLRIYWSEALHPALVHIHHANRTISLTGLPGSNVGYDIPIEKENLSISRNVERPSRKRTEKYTAELNFCGPVTRGMSKVLLSGRTRTARQMVSIAADVQLVVQYLQTTLGSTWPAAC